MNPVLILTHNNLELTKRCVESIHAQDIPTLLLSVDNGSTDGTYEWLQENGANGYGLRENFGVSRGWNLGLSHFFMHNGFLDHDSRWPHVLVVGNDTVLPRRFYRTLLSYDEDFITGIAVDDIKIIDAVNAEDLQEIPRQALSPHPDFSAFLIRWEFYSKYHGPTIGGPFDEAMVNYCSDCDLHIRGHQRGNGMWKVAMPFYHERSSTMRLAPPEEQAALHRQAGADREVFRKKWGCLPGTPEYEALFK